MSNRSFMRHARHFGSHAGRLSTCAQVCTPLLRVSMVFNARSPETAKTWKTIASDNSSKAQNISHIMISQVRKEDLRGKDDD